MMGVVFLSSEGVRITREDGSYQILSARDGTKSVANYDSKGVLRNEIIENAFGIGIRNKDEVSYRSAVSGAKLGVDMQINSGTITEGSAR